MSEKSNLKIKLTEFEKIVNWFDQNENLDVEKAIEKYKAGAKLADEIKNQLELAKNEINVL